MWADFSKGLISITINQWTIFQLCAQTPTSKPYDATSSLNALAWQYLSVCAQFVHIASTAQHSLAAADAVDTVETLLRGRMGVI